MANKSDPWPEGYEAGLNGLGYDANPYDGGPFGTAWAFGRGQGATDRNVEAFSRIVAAMRGENIRQ